MPLRAWLQAARPLAFVNIAIPLLVGQGLAKWATGAFSWTLCGLVLAAGLLDQLFIVFANDVADEEGDRGQDHPTPFSGGSRVLVEGKLDAGALRRAAWLAAIALGVLSTYTAVAFDRAALVPLWAGGVALLWSYSFPPLRLSYRGMGELAQGLGVGVVLPAIGYYAQAGSFDELRWLVLVPLFLLGFAGNITTALPDAAADARCDKRSWPVRYGFARARKHSLQLIAAAVFMTPFVLPGVPRWIWAAVEGLPALVLLAGVLELKRDPPQGPEAERDAAVRSVLVNGAAANLVMLGWFVATILLPPGLAAQG